MKTLENTVAMAADDATIMSAEIVDAGSISIEEIAMREEKSCACICEYDAS